MLARIQGNWILSYFDSLVGEQNGQPLWKTVEPFLIKVSMYLPHTTCNPTLGTLPKRNESLPSHKNSCECLQQTDNCQKLYTTGDQLIDKSAQPYKGMLFRGKKTTQLNLKCIMLSERKQTQKATF